MHRADRVREAEAGYRRVLRMQPDNGDALHLLGLLCFQAGDPRAAAAFVGQAIQASGPVPVFCENLGTILRESGNHEAAAACYCQAIAGAERPDLCYELGRCLLQCGRDREAAAAFERATELAPDSAGAFLQLGNARYRLARPDEAEIAYRRAIALDPGLAEAHYNLGTSLMGHDRHADAIACFREAVRLKPDYAEAHNNLGIVLHTTVSAEAAEPHYREALARRPEYVDARYNLARALQDRDRLEEAARAYHDVIHRKHDHAEALNNLGNTLTAMGRVAEADAAYAKALQHDPGQREARFAKALLDLMRGDYGAGWEGYELRTTKPPAPPLARWDGKPLDGRRILLQAEQGFGDTLQFIRFSRRIHELGGLLIVACQDPLQRILLTAKGVDRVVPMTGPLPPSDCYLPLLSAPGVLGAGLANIPRDTPYLEAAMALVRDWSGRLNIPPDHVKVGIAWAGNAKPDPRRSIDPIDLRILAGIPKTTFVSLQKGSSAGCDESALQFAALDRELTDFADTAALMMNLDLVISVDTSVAHLAGALARPVWTLLPFAADWRWMRDRSDSPWYPTMRLFRQTRRNDWISVLERVRDELASGRTR